MKRFEIQKNIAKAARKLASKFENGSSKANPNGGTSTVVVGGKPNNVLGFVLTQAGVVGKKTTIFGADVALAKTLNTSTELLPANVVTAANNLIDVDRPTAKGLRSQLVKPLRTFADAIGAAAIRKPYVKSGLYTAGVKQTGAVASF